MRPLVLLRATIVCSFAVGVGALYVLVHEYRRKEKRRLREAKAAAAERHSPSKAGPIGRARLIAILEESAAAAYQLIEQTRRLVVQKSQQDGCRRATTPSPPLCRATDHPAFRVARAARARRRSQCLLPLATATPPPPASSLFVRPESPRLPEREPPPPAPAASRRRSRSCRRISRRRWRQSWVRSARTTA